MNTAAQLVLAPPTLLQAATIPADMVITRALLDRSPTNDPVNTLILTWADLGPLTLTSATARGQHVNTSRAHGRDLLYGIGPGPAVAEHLRRLGDVPPSAPLLVAQPQGDNRLHLYSQVRLRPHDGCFLRTTAEPVTATELDGFVTKYRDDIQAWDFTNHLYEITGPEDQAGYVSYIPTTTPYRYRQKRKWFTTDTLARREKLTDITITEDLDTHVHRTFGEAAERLPSFRRRYDINVESIRTGNYIGIFLDHCQITEAPQHVLVQCEIEYCRTRTVLPPSESAVHRDLAAVCALSHPGDLGGRVMWRRSTPG